MPTDVSAWIEFGKVFGFPALVTGAVLYMVWRGLSALHRDILKPTADDIRAGIRQAGPAALQVRDDVAEVKDAALRIERRQNEHFEICAGVAPRHT